MMYYMQRPDVYFRDYGSVGYLVNAKERADRVVDQVGAAFLGKVGRQPRRVSEIAGELSLLFGVSAGVIESDAIEFLDLLTQDGFLGSGETGGACLWAAYGSSMTSRSANRSAGEPDSQEVLARHFAGDPRLLALQVEVTSLCNERCLHCYIPAEKRAKGIDFDFFSSILRQASELGVVSLSLSGGEPMLHPRFVNLLEVARELDFSIRILSNLTLLDDSKLEAIVDSRVDLVSVSVYSMQAAIHDAVTQRQGSFSRTMAAIERLQEEGIRVSVNTPLLKTNSESAGDVMRWAMDRSISVVADCTIMARYDHSTDNLAQRLSGPEVERAMRQIVETDPAYLRAVRDDGAESRKKIDPDLPICGVGTSSISVVANGNVNPCAAWQGEVLGNLHKDSLADLWTSSPRLAWLRSMRMGKLSTCLSCADSAFCAICMARNANSSSQGDPLELSQAHCEAAATNHQIVREALRDGGVGPDSQCVSAP